MPDYQAAPSAVTLGWPGRKGIVKGQIVQWGNVWGNF